MILARPTTGDPNLDAWFAVTDPDYQRGYKQGFEDAKAIMLKQIKKMEALSTSTSTSQET